MKNPPEFPASPATMRRRAERRLAQVESPGPGGVPSNADARRLVHELQVHQIELEMQNEELQLAQGATELAMARFVDLFDFAPVGFLRVDRAGVILESNMTGAALLGTERSRLLRRRLASLAVAEARVGVGDFVVRLFARPGKQSCEARLLRPGGVPFWAHLHGVAEAVDGSVPRAARVAVSDTTPIKEAEAARRRVEMLEMANQELRREIAQRQRAESDLTRVRERQASLLVEANQMQRQLRHLSRRILHAQEEERKRISRELHDQVTQTLVGVHVHLSALMRVAGVTPEEQGRRILRAQRLLEESVDLVHGFARELRPPVLDDIGLIEALRGFLGEFRERTGQRVGFSAFAGVDRVSNARRIVLFRVAQSALNNVAEHAHASVVRLRIRRVGDLIRMEVIDNGRSFNVAEVLHARKNLRLGLIGMRERVEMVGGEFSVVSVQGRGTTVRADVPMALVGGRGPVPG